MKLENDKIGIGIIGAGVIAGFHARAISEIEGASLLGVYSRTKSKADTLADQYHATGYDSLDEMLQNEQIKLVCICTPSGMHLDAALTCIRAGRHCLIEKPLEISTERCDQIIHAAKQKSVQVGVVFQSRFYEAEQQIREAIAGQKLGDIVLGDAYVKWHRTPEYYQSAGWRGTKQYDGGGALMNQGIHAVDLLQWMAGAVKSVKAYTANVRHKDIEVEDTVVASLRFENGALGVVECSTAIYPGAKRRIEISGTRGSIVLEGDEIAEWNLPDSPLEGADNQAGKMSNISAGASDPKDISFVGHQLQIENMLYSIRQDVPPAVTAEEGRKSVSIVEAIYESAQSGKEVIVN